MNFRTCAVVSAVAASVATQVNAGGDKVAFPEGFDKGTLYAVVDRYDIRQYRELYASKEAVDAVRRQRIQRAVADLPERQRRIIELRFGFGGESASLETIGKELGLTRERVRQLESEALHRLQLELGDELVWAA